MLVHQLERVQQSKRIDEWVVATSTSSSDDPIVEICNSASVRCYRGSLEDVLDRFYRAALSQKPDHIVRLTGDCPLADPDVIDAVIDFHLQGVYDYSTNAVYPTFPDGLDVEIFTADALSQAWRGAKLAWQREHVTPFINQQPDFFKLGHYRTDFDYSDLRWTVDEPADFEFVKQVYETLYPENPNFRLNDILALLERRPDLVKINSHLIRNEGMQKSILAEKKSSS